MTTDYPLTVEQHALLTDAEGHVQRATQTRDLIVQTILAGHHVTAGHVSAITATTLTVTTPDPDSVPGE